MGQCIVRKTAPQSTSTTRVTQNRKTKAWNVKHSSEIKPWYEVCWQTGIKRPRVVKVIWSGTSRDQADVICDVIDSSGNYWLAKILVKGILDVNRKEVQEKESKKITPKGLDRMVRRMVTSPFGGERQPPFAAPNNYGQGGGANGDAWS